MVVVLAMVAPIHRTRNKSTGFDLFVDATYLAPRYRAAPSPLPAARHRTARTEKTKRHAQARPPCAFALPFAADRPLLRRLGSPGAAGAEIGRAHVCTPVTKRQLVCRLLLETKTTK